MADYHKEMREAKLREYYTNPKLCNNCNKIIDPKPGEKISNLKNRNFCCRNCAMLWRNKNLPNSKMGVLLNKTKVEVYDQYKHRALARTTIGKNANRMAKKYGIEYKCFLCGRVEEDELDLCHIRPVSDFPDDALISEINAKNNIIYLDINCHKDFDCGTLDESQLQKIKDHQSYHSP